MRITTNIVLFYVFLTAGANLITEVGFADALGLTISATAGESFGEAVQALGDIQGNGLAVESLLGLYTVATSSAEGFLVALTQGPRVMVNLGIPTEFVIFLHAPLGLIGARFILYVLTGRDA